MKPKVPSVPPSDADRKRLLVVAIAIFGVFALLIIQFFNVQIVEGDRWADAASQQHRTTVAEPFRRGLFYANMALPYAPEGAPRPLMIDVLKYHLYIDPESIPEEVCQEVAQKLAEHLSLPADGFASFRAEFDKESRSRRLAMWLDQQQRDQISEWWLPYARKHKIARNAVFFVGDYRRLYPYGKLLGQALHTVAVMKDEVTKQSIPTGGLEAYFQDALKGKLGLRRLTRSPHNPLDTGTVLEAPEDGADVYLSINFHLQAVAEEELELGIKRAHAKSGWAVIMDPYSGEILALAQYPFFYPERYQDYFNDPEQMLHTRARALIDVFEMGSIMKPITLAIALTANEVCRAQGKPPIFDPHEKVAVSDGHFPGRRKPITDTHHHHYLNMYMGLQRSSNIYMGRIIDRVIKTLGNDWYRSQLVDVFQFGKKTGLELPAESPGMIPTPGKLHPNGKLEWSVPTPYSLAMGYNMLANSVQMARAYALFANGGYLVRPTLVRKIVRHHLDGTEEVLLDNTLPERRQLFPRVLSTEVARHVLNTMRFTTKPRGSAWHADVMGYTEAGKTGTSRKIVNGLYTNKRYFANFVGVVPADHPRFILCVSVDEPGRFWVAGQGDNYYGGQSAGPIFRQIAQRALEVLGVPPDDPAGYPKGDPRYNPEKANWVRETEALNRLYDQWNGKH